MPKRRSDGREGGSAAKRRRRRRHLYLVIDDWRWGYSIRKVDLPSADSDSDDADGQTAAAADVSGEATVDYTKRRLPPAAVRVEAPRGMPYYFAAAFGTKIMAMHPYHRAHTHPLVPKHLVQAFDVHTRGIVYGPRPKTEPLRPPIYIPVGDRLFALGVETFEKLYPPPLDEPGGENHEWSWCELQKPSFNPSSVTAYAVHPDGRTIFFGTVAATFSFDTSEDADEDEDKFRWTRHGEWTLPFHGRAHYDRALDAWVGLSNYTDTLGHICSCDVVAPDGSARSYDSQGRCLAPAKKLSKENLFVSEDQSEMHVGATLVSMGGGSRYCLVQCTGIEYKKGYYEDDEDEPISCRFLFRLTTFSLKYDKNGDLTTGDSRRVLYYKVPEGAVNDSILINPVAFWM